MGLDKSKTVFRAKSVGKTLPKIGLPISVQPGDQLTFIRDGVTFCTREVGEVYQGFCTTKPLASQYGVLEGSRRVPWKDFYEATRSEEGPPESDDVLGFLTGNK